MLRLDYSLHATTVTIEPAFLRTRSLHVTTGLFTVADTLLVDLTTLPVTVDCRSAVLRYVHDLIWLLLNAAPLIWLFGPRFDCDFGVTFTQLLVLVDSHLVDLRSVLVAAVGYVLVRLIYVTV